MVGLDRLYSRKTTGVLLLTKPTICSTSMHSVRTLGVSKVFLAKEHLVPKNHPYPCLVGKKRADEYMFVQYSMLTFCDIKLRIITASHVKKVIGHLLSHSPSIQTSRQRSAQAPR